MPASSERNAARATRRPRWHAIAALVAAISACSNDPGLLVAPRDAASEASAAGPDATPFDRTLQLVGRGEPCVRCMREKCEERARACAADPACAADVECALDCRDPECHLACQAEFRPGQRPSSPLEACAVESCLDACAIGRDLGCVDDWRLPSPEAAVTVLRLQLGDLTPRPLLEEGLRARVCRSPADIECASPESTVLSNADGQLELRLPSDFGDNRGYTPFSGFIALDDPEREPRILPTLLFVELPWQRSYEHFIDTLVFTPAITPFTAVTTARGEALPAPSPGTGSIGGVVFDCRASNSARSVGLMLEVSGAPQALIASPELTNGTGFFAATNLPPGSTTVALKDGARVVATRSVPVIADKVTYLWLFPSSHE